MRRLSLALALSILLVGPAWAATPTLVQRVLTGFEDNVGGSVFDAGTLTLSLPNPVGAGNLVVLVIQYNSAYAAPTITDNKGTNTWTAGPTKTDVTNGQRVDLYYSLNTASGTQTINFAFTNISQTIYFGAAALEYYNVATSAATDGSTAGLQSTSPYSPGSMTTTTAGDLIVSAYIETSANGGANLTSITAPTNFTMRLATQHYNNTIPNGIAVADWVQSSAGAINPSWATVGNTTNSGVTLQIAFKNAAAGTAPTQSPRILGWQSQWLGISPISNIMFPCFGNLLVAQFNDDNGFITAVSDSAGNTWSLPAGLKVTNGTFITVQLGYAANATTSSTYTYSPTVNATAGNPFVKMYDVTGAATSPLGATSTSSGTQSANGNLTQLTITPTQTGSVIIMGDSHQYHTTNAITSPSGGVLDAVVNSRDDNGAGGTNPSDLDEDNTYAHVYTTGTSAINFTFGFNTSRATNLGIGDWAAVGAEFVAPAAASAFGGAKRQKLQRYYGEP